MFSYQYNNITGRKISPVTGKAFKSDELANIEFNEELEQRARQQGNVYQLLQDIHHRLLLTEKYLMSPERMAVFLDDMSEIVLKAQQDDNYGPMEIFKTILNTLSPSTVHDYNYRADVNVVIQSKLQFIEGLYQTKTLPDQDQRSGRSL